MLFQWVTYDVLITHYIEIICLELKLTPVNRHTETATRARRGFAHHGSGPTTAATGGRNRGRYCSAVVGRIIIVINNREWQYLHCDEYIISIHADVSIVFFFFCIRYNSTRTDSRRDSARKRFSTSRSCDRRVRAQANTDIICSMYWNIILYIIILFKSRPYRENTACVNDLRFSTRRDRTSRAH